MVMITLFTQSAIPSYASQAIVPILKLTERIWRLTIKYFNLIQAAGVLGFGAQEYGLGFLPNSIKWKIGQHEKVDGLNPVKKILAAQTSQCGVHGLLYLGSGALCTAGELEAANFINLGGTGPALLKSGWTLFLFANLFSLEQNIKLYQAATKIEGTLGHRLKATAILGMINNLGYVLGTIFSFFPVTTSIAIALAILAIMAGTIKFFYDFFLINLPSN